MSTPCLLSPNELANFSVIELHWEQESKRVQQG